MTTRLRRDPLTLEDIAIWGERHTDYWTAADADRQDADVMLRLGALRWYRPAWSFRYILDLTLGHAPWSPPLPPRPPCSRDDPWNDD